jgi:phage-related protein
MDAFCGAVNANEFVTITGDDFPVLTPGANNISLSGHISNIQITPRWFTL